MKDNKGIIAIVIIGIILVMAIVGAGGVVAYRVISKSVFVTEKEKTTEQSIVKEEVGEVASTEAQSTKESSEAASTEGQTTEDSSVLDELEEVEEETETNDIEGATALVLGGYEFQIPNAYGSYIDDEKGPIIYLDEDFYILLGVRDDTVSAKLKDPSSITNQAVKAGGTITKDLETKTVNGCICYYYEYTDGEFNFLVCGSESPDKAKRFGGVVSKLDQSKSTEDYLNLYLDLVSTAKVSSKADTTSDEYIEAKTAGSIGEKKSETTLSMEGTTVKCSIPSGFYSEYDYESENMKMEQFTDVDFSLSVEVSLYNKGYVESAKSYMEQNQKVYASGTYDQMKLSEVKSTTVNGYTYYYFTCSYNDDDGEETQKIEVACDTKSGLTYYVKGRGTCYDSTLTIDTLEDFLKIQE